MSEPIASGEEILIEADDEERLSLAELPALATYGRYELLGRIAFGGMAEIFLARETGHHDTHRMMVVKRVMPHVAEDEQFVQMFVDEARLAIQLNHPHICHVYGFGEEDGSYYLAMEWVNGKPLSKIIRAARARGGIPIPIALKIIAQVAEALDYAHRATDASGEPLGVVHRDVSPQNIMVSYDGVVKLLDFGIAKAASHSSRTEAGVIKGKFAYMSPQQCVGEPIDARADIFALGICLYESLTAKHAFKRKTEFETMQQIVGEPAPKASAVRPEVKDELEAVIQKALMKQPERRHQSAGELQLELEQLIPTFGLPVNAARMGDWMTELFPTEAREGPSLDFRVSAPPQAAESSARSIESDPSLRQPRPDATERGIQPLSAASPAPKEGSRRSRALLVIGLVAAFLVPLLAMMFFFSAGDTPVESRADSASGAAQPRVPESPTEPPVAEGSETSAEAPATSGSVFLESQPPGATVRLGERGVVGTTPIEVGMVAPGSHTASLELEGHEAWRQEITVGPGERVVVSQALVPTPSRVATARQPERSARPPGRISVNSRPWSKVYLGRRLLGTTPIGRVQIPSGRQRLRLVDRDGNQHRRTVVVGPGEHVAQSYDLR